MRVTEILFIAGALGTVPKGFERGLEVLEFMIIIIITILHSLQVFHTFISWWSDRQEYW